MTAISGRGRTRDKRITAKIHFPVLEQSGINRLEDKPYQWISALFPSFPVFQAGIYRFMKMTISSSFRIFPPTLLNEAAV